jgi:beta-glucanase (GH16 family)
VITARREAWRGPAYPVDLRDSPEKRAARADKPFTSARLSTKGKAAWRYGRVEVRAKLPGAGELAGNLDAARAGSLWPLGGLGRDRHSRNGQPGRAVPHLHRRAGGSRAGHDPLWRHSAGQSPSWRRDAHSRPGRWLSHLCRGLGARIDHWSIDGVPYETRRAGEWSTTGSTDPLAPFDQPFHLVLNLAIGGGLPESRNGGGVDNTGFPRSMMVDWVRVWQSDAVAAAPAATK